MDNYEYLQQISKSNRPLKPVKTSHLPNNFSLIVKILVGAFLGLILLAGIGLLVKSSSTQSADTVKQLYARMNNVSNLIAEYNPNLKSSQLRAINSSLSSVISSTLPQLSAYLESVSDDSETALIPPTKLLEEEGKLYEDTNKLLAEAKLNGTLDRIYSSQIHMQVTLLMTLTGETLIRNDDATLTEILNNFYSNLSVIEQTLNNYTSN